MASTPAPLRSAIVPPPAAQSVLPDEILEDIFLRLDGAADLARVCAACSSFRRIVVSDSERAWFLRRFQSLHSPPLLGFIEKDKRKFAPADPPHRYAPEARALQKAADFTFSFLPRPHSWDLCDARDGRVLLSRRISTKIHFDDFLVCDPLYRRYVEIPRIPDHLLASATHTAHLFPVLAPAGENDDDEGSFRIICTLPPKGKKIVAFVFSSSDQTWRAIASTIHVPEGYKFTEPRPYHAHGCLYWIFYGIAYSLMLDTSEMEFSVIDLPPNTFESERAIVEAEEGTLKFLAMDDDAIDVYCKKNWQGNGVGAQEWQLDQLVSFPKDSGVDYYWTIVTTVGHYLALLASRDICHNKLQKCEYFLLDTKTLLLEKVCTSGRNVVRFGVPYARFPPPFALPSI